jgi:hypothetical protein
MLIVNTFALGCVNFLNFSENVTMKRFASHDLKELSKIEISLDERLPLGDQIAFLHTKSASRRH